MAINKRVFIFQNCLKQILFFLMMLIVMSFGNCASIRSLIRKDKTKEPDAKEKMTDKITQKAEQAINELKDATTPDNTKEKQEQLSESDSINKKKTDEFEKAVTPDSAINKQGQLPVSDHTFDDKHKFKIDCDDNLEYATDWIDLKGLNPGDQLARIKSEIDVLVKKINNKQFKLLTSKETQCLNQQWQEEKSSKNKEWFTTLFEKENAYRTNLHELNTIIQRLKDCNENQETLDQEISTLKNRISFLRQRIDQLVQWRKNLKNDLGSRLANIPISILLVARIKRGPVDLPKPLKNIMTNQMITAAVKNIIGEQVQTYSIVMNDTLIKNAVATIIGGNAQVSDTYFRDTGKVIPPNPEVYIYQIHRIEVFPFNKEKPKYPSDIKDEKHISDIYTIDSDNLVEIKGRKRYSFDDHKLSILETQFIQNQYLMSQNTNQRIEDEIKRFRKEYDDKYEAYSKDIRKLEIDLNALETKRSTKETEITGIKTELSKLGEKVKTKQAEYKQAMFEYENYYRNKMGYVNKYEQWGSQNLPYTEQLQNMAHSAYNNTDQLRKEYIKATVWMESVGKNAEVRKTIKREIQYQAETDRFKILYLTFYSDPDLSFLLNIGFEMRWRSESGLKLDTNIVVDSQNKLKWKQASNTLKSRNVPGESPGPNWRLPTFEELVLLSKIVKEQLDDSGIDIFDRLKWPKEDAPYLSSDSGLNDLNENVNKCYNFKKNIIEERYNEEGIFILWVMDIKN